MAYDDDTIALHLTLSGWVTGDPPADRVETWELHSHQAFGWSKEYRTWRCLWANPAVPRSERDKIRSKFADRMGREGREGDTITDIGEPL